MAILSEGRNCWRRISAERVACLIGGDAYFKALIESLQQDKGPEIEFDRIFDQFVHAESGESGNFIG